MGCYCGQRQVLFIYYIQQMSLVVKFIIIISIFSNQSNDVAVYIYKLTTSFLTDCFSPERDDGRF